MMPPGSIQHPDGTGSWTTHRRANDRHHRFRSGSGHIGTAAVARRRSFADAMARRRAVLPLRAYVPDPADQLPDPRRLPERRPASSRSKTSRLLFQPTIVAAYWISIKVSLASAILGALIGLAIAIAIVRGGLPGWVRSTTMTFSGVASNFAGVPLAFAFLATLGRLGLVTVLLDATSASTSTATSASTSSPSGA